MSFPAPSVTPPSLSDYQYSFGGLNFGASLPIAVMSSDGLDLPKIRSGDAAQPLDTGEFEGLDFAGGRDITLQLHAQAGSNDNDRRLLVQELDSVLLPPTDGLTEQPLWIQRPGRPLLVSMVRARRYGFKSDRNFAQAKIFQPLVSFHATDPRFYGVTQSTTASAPGIVSGWSFPWDFPWPLGSGTEATIIDVDNTGTFETRPLLTVTGPCTNPSLANLSQPGVPTLTFDLTMNAGDQLVVDLLAGSASYYSAGSSIGYPRTNTLAPGFSWWNCPPGVSQVQFSSQSGTGTLEVDWAPAWLVAI